MRKEKFITHINPSCILKEMVRSKFLNESMTMHIKRILHVSITIVILLIFLIFLCLK
jgi:hypothetical protein